jgi:hypothetical protein
MIVSADHESVAKLSVVSRQITIDSVRPVGILLLHNKKLGKGFDVRLRGEHACARD